MNGSELLFLCIVFLVVAAIALVGMLLFAPQALRERLRGHTPGSAQQPGEGGQWIERVARVAEPFTRLSLPEEGWERSTLRTRFMNAGWRSASAPTLYFAAKTVLALGLPALAAIALAGAGDPLRKYFIFFLFTAAAIGYYLPNVVLARTAASRRREIFENIPDALDLLTVCVEAGLSMERALSQVAAEYTLSLHDALPI